MQIELCLENHTPQSLPASVEEPSPPPNQPPPEKTAGLGEGHWERKYPPVPGESAIERKKRLHRIANQKNKYKNFPNRKPINPTRKTLLFTKESLLENCIVDPITKCWVWQRARHEFGYGIAMENKKHVRMNRRAWELWVGPIPQGMFVCHKCDNPSCCNYQHLFLGTNLDNLTDMHSKGRWTVPNRKLTDAQASSIKRDNRTLVKIALDFGVSQSVIHSIKSGRTYQTSP